MTLAANASWLVPAALLRSTGGETKFAFYHPESVWGRVVEIIVGGPPCQAILCGLAPLGLVVLARRDRVAAAALVGFLAAGFGWGYLAGWSRALDFLQPGRHTYAFFSAVAVAAGIGLAEIVTRVRGGGLGRLDRWLVLGLTLVGGRFLGPPMVASVQWAIRPNGPFSSRPSPRFLWMLDRVRRHVLPGERLLYEEGGLSLPGVPDPYAARNFSGYFPTATGVEMIGGPYLHTTVAANFTQFGEGKLFGKADWGRDHFERYARLYRPAAILCWSPKARAFCRDNPDLIRILDDDGTVLIGRVAGFEGATIRGSAQVHAETGLLHVEGAVAGADGLVVLRYHFAPHLRTSPTVPLEPVTLEGDPVPFIAFRPPPGLRSLDVSLSPFGK